jgi:uncharacterized membrane protein
MSVEAERPPTEVHAARGMARLIRHTEDDPGARPALIHRVILVLAAFSLFSTLLAATGPTVRWGFLGVVLAGGVCVLVGVIVCGFVVQTMRAFGRVETILLVVALGALALWTIANILNYPPYRSDEEIFVQYSADLLRQGHNPYGADMMPAYVHYPSPFPTKLLDGGITHSLDYPGLPTLLTAGLSAVVGTYHTVALMCTLALFAAALVMFYLLPKGLRALAPLLVVGIPVLASGSSGGLLFSLVVAPLAFTAYRWQHTGETGRLSRMDVAKAAAVGIAISTTQVAWFPIPFLFLGIYLRRKQGLGRRAAAGVVGRFVAVAFLVFFLINAVFIFWGPDAWLHGVLAPIIQHAVPEGQGLINLIQSLSIGSGNLSLYTYAGALVMLGLLVAYWRHFDRLHAACFALPLIGLLFPARSYWTYFIAYGAAWMVELLSHDPEPEPSATAAAAASAASSDSSPSPTPTARGLRAWLAKPIVLTAAAFLPALAVFGAALASQQPLQLTITSYQTTGAVSSVQTITVSAKNTSGHTLKPHFMVVHGDGLVTATWNIVSGPDMLAPHSQARYVLSAPSYDALAWVKQSMKIQAVTDQPPTVSFSGSKLPEPFTTLLTADTPTMPILDPNQTITLTARLQSNYGQPVHRSGVKVCMAANMFTNSGDGKFSVTINGTASSNACSLTDSEGAALFQISSPSTGGRPLYFNTYASQGSGSYGYSKIISAAWR